MRSPILSKKGITPEMQFSCLDCNEQFSGQDILDGTEVHLVFKDTQNPLKSLLRCELCQEELEDREAY